MHFRDIGWGWVVALGFGMASGCQVGLAQDEAPAADAPVVSATSSDAPAQSDDVGEVPAPVRMHEDHQVMGTDRWENALDAKLTNLFDRKASDVGSPTVMLTALWNRKFRYNTYLGLTVSGLPQSHAKREDGIKTSYTMYYGGLNLAQGIYEAKPFRAIFQVSGGEGMTYVRVTGDDIDAKAHAIKFRYVEPALVVMVYEWDHLEMGLIGTNRIARLDSKSEDLGVENKDLSSVSYGLTFRTERW